ncbi:SRPBCC domain-containing protein [Mycobacterium sp. LTG2003]
MNPELDLSVERIIRAPRKAVWEAWTNPDSLAQWWIPAPTMCRVDRLDVRPGGAFVTQMSDDGLDFVPHLDACFLLVDEFERLVFTNAVDSEWRPANPAPISMTAEITMYDHPSGTDYRVVARHGDPAARNLHVELGFDEGWGTVADQLARFAESAHEDMPRSPSAPRPSSR